MNLCKTRLIGDESQASLKIARIENMLDQFVGGEILKVVYSRLHIPMVLVDLPAKEAIPEAIEKNQQATLVEFEHNCSIIYSHFELHRKEEEHV